MMNLDRFKHYTVGIPEIDNEHWEICTFVNEVFKFSKDGNVPALTACVEELLDKLQHHFDNEEAIMQENLYPWLTAHKESHLKLTTLVKNFLSQTGDRNYVSTFFASNLEELLIEHIDHQDRQYEIFKENNKK